MNYQQTLDYLYNTLPMFSRMGSAAFKKDITNIRLLCEQLGNPHIKFKSIHVGGTNGKGSVSHMLAAIFQASGYNTGLHTSPHLYDFRERIKLNGQMVSEEFVVEFVEKIKPLSQEIEPSFFEITVAMAFQYFAEQKVDIAIIEVGLGGRLDSTNIITPELSIITNIGWDHMNMLGNTLQEIAMEKAGIIKENIPVVIGESLPETRPVFETVAGERKAPIHFSEGYLKEDGYDWGEEFFNIHYKKKDGSSLEVKTDLAGIYQSKNVRTVLTTMPILKANGWKIKDEAHALTEVKKRTGLSGRWEVIHKEPTVVLEVAHNKNGIEQMLLHVRQLSFGQLHIIIGIVKDKNVEQILSLFPASANYHFTQANIPRALPANELKQKANELKLIGNSYDDVNIALKTSLKMAANNDVIIVCGSIFLVAEVDRSLVTST